MKKRAFITLLLAIMLMAVPVMIITMDKVNSADLSLYTDLSAAKGLELYVWRSNDDLAFGLLPGTNILKFQEEYELLREHPATLSQMKDILEAYPVSADEIFIIALDEAISEAEIQLARNRLELD